MGSPWAAEPNRSRMSAALTVPLLIDAQIRSSSSQHSLMQSRRSVASTTDARDSGISIPFGTVNRRSRRFASRGHKSKPSSRAKHIAASVFIWTSQLFADCLALAAQFMVLLVHFCRLWRQTAFLCLVLVFVRGMISLPIRRCVYLLPTVAPLGLHRGRQAIGRFD